MSIETKPKDRFAPGDSVHYTAPHGAKENGIVKEVSGQVAWVVFKCGDNWENYRDYTAASTPFESLTHGWHLPTQSSDNQ